MGEIRGSGVRLLRELNARGWTSKCCYGRVHATRDSQKDLAMHCTLDESLRALVNVPSMSSKLKFLLRISSCQSFPIHDPVHVAFSHQLKVYGSCVIFTSTEYDRNGTSKEDTDRISDLRNHRSQSKIISILRNEELAIPDNALDSEEKINN